MYNDVTFEISGICNAKCYWCQTGIRDGIGVTQQNQIQQNRKGFVDIEEFKKSVLYMKKQGFVRERANFNLQNWGEPFIHPKFMEIVEFLKQEKFSVLLSTNAGKYVEFGDSQNLSHIKSIRFSMCGFSQDSYDRIHKLSFDTVLQNIKKIMGNFRARGFAGYAEIGYHLYQFNLDELEAAKDFAHKNDLFISPHVAVINDYERNLKYISSKMDYEELKKAGQELLLHFMDIRLKDNPSMYVCPQLSMLTIDECCNVITCCGDSTAYKKIYDIHDLPEINFWRENSAVCKTCLSAGAAFAGHNLAIAAEVLGGRKGEMFLDVVIDRIKRELKRLLGYLKS